jgi:hypothetical protein
MFYIENDSCVLVGVLGSNKIQFKQKKSNINIEEIESIINGLI